MSVEYIFLGVFVFFLSDLTSSQMIYKSSCNEELLRQVSTLEKRVTILEEKTRTSSELASPSISIPKSSYSVNYGSAITIPCNVSASPPATSISWYKDVSSSPIVITGRYSGGTTTTPSLTIFSAQRTDEGNYRCSATNDIGTSSSIFIFIDVIGASPSVSIPKSSYSVNYGSTITIPCNVSTSPSATFVSWYKDVSSSPIVITGRYSGGTTTTPSLTISSAKRTDEGNYRCLVTSDLGTRSSISTFLDVIGGPACLAEWTHFQNSCYRVFNTKITWTAAQEICWNHGSKLVEIERMLEDKFIGTELLSNYGKSCDVYFWTGGVYNQQRGTWVWIASNRSVTYTNWRRGEPNSLTGDDGRLEDRIEFSRSDTAYSWNDNNILTSRYFICENE